MKTFYLKSKLSKEVINKTVCQSLELAIDYFSKVKDMEKDDLLRIFVVTDK